MNNGRFEHVVSIKCNCKVHEMSAFMTRKTLQLKLSYFACIVTGLYKARKYLAAMDSNFHLGLASTNKSAARSPLGSIINGPSSGI